MSAKKKNKSKSKSGLSTIFAVHGEMVQNHGEDSYYYAVSGNKALIGAFDGCGGIGSRRYQNFSGNTGAYVASRAVCGGVKSWFESSGEEPVKAYIERSLAVCNKYADKEGRLMGSLGKSFPTTAAIIQSECDNNAVNCKCYWAGDSRCYVLDENGLHQLSLDDIDGEDAYSNISGDGVLTNVINASVGFELHEKTFTFKKPCVLITSTDGCFGYLNSPMEFEYVLLETMRNANGADEWKENLRKEIVGYTGDDYTLCVAAYGNDSFQSMRKHFSARRDFVYRTYIEQNDGSVEKWNQYKDAYNMYL